MNRFREFLKEKFKTFRSLRAWIFAIGFLLGIIPCIVLRLALLTNYERRAVDIRTSDVSNQLHIISDHLLTYNYLKGEGSDIIDAELSQLSNLYDGRILIINSELKVIKDTYGISEGKTIISEEVVRAVNGESISNYDNDFGYIEIVTPIVETLSEGDSAIDLERDNTIRGVMLTSVSTDNIISTEATLKRTSELVIILAALLILGVTLHISRIMTKPFRKLTASISEMKEGFSSEPVNVNNYLETEQISDAFNQVYKRMKLLDDSRQEFVANVSHELKTPMTSVKILADSLISQEDVPAELYREFMGDITKEIDRENKIISDLLSLVKMDKTSAELSISQVDMNNLIELTLKRLRPIARKMDVEVTFESFKEVTAEVDEVKMGLIITNLVENAIKYNVEHGWVKVSLDADHQFFVLKVEDSGIGIPDDDKDHVFERFYRVDKSHSREIGGTGLGLAITRGAILMHRGSIVVDTVYGEGTTFTVRIPINYVQPTN